jgi:hypothetical protein
MKFGPSIVTDGLVFAVDAANPSSYPGSGTTWKDQTINQNNGTLINGPTFDSANGGSIVFDGSNDYVDYGDNDIFTFGNGTNDEPFSISAWIKPVDNARFRIAFKWGTTLREYYFQIAGGGALQVSINSSLSVYIGRNGQTTISENVWSHVVMTYDGSGNKNNINIYLNGVLDNDSAISSGTYTAMSNTTQPFEIGRYNGGSYADGQIANTQIYNRALSTSEVLHNYYALKSRFGL